MLTYAAKKIATCLGIEVKPILAKWRGEPFNSGLLRELDATELDILRQVEQFTMTSPERIMSLIQSTRYLVRAGISGDFVECGVWRGGSMMSIALTLLSEGDLSRDLYLFDTFDGMPEPTERDRDAVGTAASELLERAPKRTNLWCFATLEEVKANLMQTGCPQEKIHFVKGRVETTLPCTDLSRLAMLRLDTDWYESTYHELQHLFPKLQRGGVLIVDDYGHWQGAKEATDQYFLEHPESAMFLQRVDYSCRVGIKSHEIERPDCT